MALLQLQTSYTVERDWNMIIDGE